MNNDHYHHIRLDFPLWPCGQRKNSQQRIIKAEKKYSSLLFLQ
ncbi:hypothetical protein STRCR_0780 [Streptococcus criceti HS-6]|uniref:Uncharacterized protein n=1 Tax=Streptococcus criceti HS-6 TaxID=873449 RepID=G5JRS2_STRCG|nr:hypothetical protein STRCR_0780 [Streptococcus criceti HS-6]